MATKKMCNKNDFIKKAFPLNIFFSVIPLFYDIINFEKRIVYERKFNQTFSRRKNITNIKK